MSEFALKLCKMGLVVRVLKIKSLKSLQATDSKTPARRWLYKRQTTMLPSTAYTLKVTRSQGKRAPGLPIVEKRGCGECCATDASS
jgi:hypothetical protein